MLGIDFVKERINHALELSESEETQVVLLAQDQVGLKSVPGAVA